MPEWWTYGLSDFLMFSSRSYHRMLEQHNRAWMPLQPLWLAAGLAVLVSTRLSAPRLPHWCMALVACSWLFVAYAFHGLRYAEINWGAFYFAFAFAVHGVLMAGLGLWHLRMRWSTDVSAMRIGTVVMGAALLWPLLTLAAGRPLAQAEWFGLAPDPTVLFTLGLWLCVQVRPGQPGWKAQALTLLVPLLWCAASAATLFPLGAPHWWLLPAAGVATLVLALRRRNDQGRQREADTSRAVPYR